MLSKMVTKKLNEAVKPIFPFRMVPLSVQIRLFVYDKASSYIKHLGKKIEKLDSIYARYVYNDLPQTFWLFAGKKSLELYLNESDIGNQAKIIAQLKYHKEYETFRDACRCKLFTQKQKKSIPNIDPTKCSNIGIYQYEKNFNGDKTHEPHRHTYPRHNSRTNSSKSWLFWQR